MALGESVQGIRVVSTISIKARITATFAVN
jgi:hypothetical protein